MCLAVVRVAFFYLFSGLYNSGPVYNSFSSLGVRRYTRGAKERSGKVEGGQVKVGLLHVCVSFHSPFSHSFIVHITDFVFSSRLFFSFPAAQCLLFTFRGEIS